VEKAQGEIIYLKGERYWVIKVIKHPKEELKKNRIKKREWGRGFGLRKYLAHASHIFASTLLTIVHNQFE
jgi:hypothetical protein